MKVKIYGWDGHQPDRTSAEEFSGDTALDIVRAMMVTPFAANLSPQEFMAQTLGRLNGRNAPSLPACALAAADAYLDHLIAIGLAERI